MTDQPDLIDDGVARFAQFSACRTWRYTLGRVWSVERPLMTFIGLNPSTADESKDDPTIRKIIGFARREDCGGLLMLNLFAFRATDPRQMKKAVDPVGPGNDAAIRAAMFGAGLIVAGWGNHGNFRDRDQSVLEIIKAADRGAFALKINGTGQPMHPLYLPNETKLIEWR